MGPLGFEHTQESTGETAGRPPSDVKSDVNSDDSPLGDLLGIWLQLSESDRAQLITLADRWREFGRKPRDLPEDGELARLIDAKGPKRFC